MEGRGETPLSVRKAGPWKWWDLNWDLSNGFDHMRSRGDVPSQGRGGSWGVTKHRKNCFEELHVDCHGLIFVENILMKAIVVLIGGATVRRSGRRLWKWLSYTLLLLSYWVCLTTSTGDGGYAKCPHAHSPGDTLLWGENFT